MKTMIHESNLFIKSEIDLDWTFFAMKSLKDAGLLNQDVVHLLAKLKTNH